MDRRSSCLVNVIFWLLHSGACKLPWNGCINVTPRRCCTRSSLVFCILLLANRIGVAASLLLSVAAAHPVSMIFCNSMFASRIGVAASTLLCVAVLHVVSWSFATCCLQVLLEWLRQSCADELLMIFLALGPLLFPSQRLRHRTFCGFWRRDLVLEQVLGQ